MLTDSQRAIVSSTVPLLEQGGEALTTYFYKMLLAEHPEVRPFFNETHQAKGAQPRALANGVLMYAKHIDRLEAMGPLATQIVNKHVALQVLPEHYPIVGRCLLRAIRDVLGAEVATDAVMDAWTAAYGQLADILIDAERARYDAQAVAPGGWRGQRAFTVQRKVRESAEITSFHLVPADGGALMDFAPGQYIGLCLTVEGRDIRRNYSLSAAPNGRSYRISVKREPGGMASNHLHDQVHAGDTLHLLPPSGGFVLSEGERPVVLISGGVGITPTLALMEQALAAERPVTFIHCARNGEVHAFREQIEEATTRHPGLLQRYYCYDEVTQGAPGLPHAVGRLDGDLLERWLPGGTRDVDAYFLGPKPFMQQVRRGLRNWGVPDAQSRFEFFGPASALE